MLASNIENVVCLSEYSVESISMTHHISVEELLSARR